MSLAMAICLVAATGTQASAETRTLKLYYIHTKERAEITYKKDGRYIQSGLTKLNRFLRDWRRNEPTKMDPRLFDIVWEAYKRAGGRDYIHVVSAYRSPATNSLLRKRSKGVAEKSQHMLGKAMDFYIPGVKLARLRAEGLKVGAGGVGYYPTSGSPFVHMDVGSVRHWPRMNRSQLMAVFPDGKTMHVPTDGKPLPGYNQALAAYQSRKSGGGSIIADASSGRRGGGFLSALFGGGADQAEEESGEVAVVVASNAQDRGAESGNARPRRQAAESSAAEPSVRPTVAPRRETPARAVAETRETLPGVAAQTPEPAAAARDVERVIEEAPKAPEAETPETIVAALPARAVPLPLAAPRPQVDVGAADVGATDIGALALASDPAVSETVAQAASAPAPAIGEAPVPPAVIPDTGSEIALNIPVPTRRPNYQADEIVSVASITLPQTAPISALGESGTQDGKGVRAIASLIAVNPSSSTAVPFPDVRPEANAVEIAALPQSRPERKLDLYSTPASQRTAILSGQSGETGAKTTRKSARPGPADLKPDPKAVVVPAEPNAARWAFSKDYVIRTDRRPTAPSFAYNIVRTAPIEVYTAGFQQGEETGDLKRFTGKAVKFLSVAKFNSN